MIPTLTLNEDFILKNWPEQETRNHIENICKAIMIKADDNKVPVYSCQPLWFDLGVYKESVQLSASHELHTYGYCDTEKALVKYLEPYIEDKDNEYYVSVGFLDIDNKKPYKFGSYINKDGKDTGEDYSDYIRANPEMQVKQEFEDQWITFSIRKLIKK